MTFLTFQLQSHCVIQTARIKKEEDKVCSNNRAKVSKIPKENSGAKNDFFGLRIPVTAPENIKKKLNLTFLAYFYHRNSRNSINSYV